MTREEAIRILASSCIPGSKQTEALETLIPELKESEDESTRKALIETLKCIYDGDTMFLSEQQRDRYLAYLEKQKEQKPAESISQLTVQGKGVYKICPRCKERMVRDDSMVYTSMPPQYRYECPKCGESECDTVMYDNPEMEEQKPAEWSEEDETAFGDLMWCIERASKSAKDENDMGNIWFAENWVKNRLKSLRPNQPKQEWSEEDERNIRNLESVLYYDKYLSDETRTELGNFLKSLPNRLNRQPKTEWSEEDKRAIDRACVALRAYANGDLPEFLPSELIGYADRLQSLSPSWKPSEVQMKALLNIEGDLRAFQYNDKAKIIAELYEQLKRL